MTNKEYADLLLPNVKHDYEYYLKKYSKRELKEGAIVTRFAPSPTGFVHMGSLLTAMTTIWYANETKGVAFLRIEDTDQKREVENGIDGILNDLESLNVYFDEDPRKGGSYGPYIQSERKDIYQAFVKKLIEEDKAYPCFCLPEEIEKTRKYQEDKKLRIGYYGKYAICRFLSKEEVIKKINNGEKYIIRLKSSGLFINKIILDDLIKGKIEMPENDMDIVLIKGDGLPTYHLAHVIDDYLMGTTHVIRGDEWISSYPIHDQLFKIFNFALPKFAHVSPINIKDGETIRKLSKRKDPWAAITYYDEKGIPQEAIKLYLATLTNSNFEEWYNNNNDKSIKDFEFKFENMSKSGPIFDMEKLLNISKTYFSRLDGKDIYNNLLIYTSKYDQEFNNILNENKDYTISILNIERKTLKPRKDISCYKDIKELFWYMYEELFIQNKDDYEEITNVTKDDLVNYINKIFDSNDTQEEWFQKLSGYANEIGYINDRKSYKENPNNYKGTTADFCKIIRIIITKKNISPNLYDILLLLGKERLLKRIDNYFNK